MSHLDFPIKASAVTILNFADHRQTEIHAAGCAHEGTAAKVNALSYMPAPTDPYADDWYHVAPCARKAS